MSLPFLNRLAALCCVGVVGVGCASMDAQVVARASKDFSCDREHTVITDRFGGIYRMEGCGFVATYECREDSALHTSCDKVEGTDAVATHGARID